MKAGLMDAGDGRNSRAAPHVAVNIPGRAIREIRMRIRLKSCTCAPNLWQIGELRGSTLR
jgi:hypothetical protein